MGTSRTMLHTSLSAKKSSPVNCRLFNAPSTSKKNGSLRQPAKKRYSPASATFALASRRDRRPFDDDLPAIARPGGLRALDAPQRRGLRPALGGREAHPVCDIGDGITIRVDLELVHRLGREGLGGGGPRRVHDGGRMHVHDQDRLAAVARLGEGIEIGEVQSRVPVREPEVGTGIMVRHGSFTPLSASSRTKATRGAREWRAPAG